jgi:hypothetical protein
LLDDWSEVSGIPFFCCDDEPGEAFFPDVDDSSRCGVLSTFRFGLLEPPTLPLPVVPLFF